MDSASATLHPDVARGGKYLDRKGKGSTVPRRPIETGRAGGEFSVGMDERKVSMSSNGSVRGDEDGYVAVSLEDGVGRR